VRISSYLQYYYYYFAENKSLGLYLVGLADRFAVVWALSRYEELIQEVPGLQDALAYRFCDPSY
jgi:hypothetical protein